MAREGGSRGRVHSALRVVGGHRQPGWEGQDENEALCAEKGAASWVTCWALVQCCLGPKGRGSAGPALTHGQTPGKRPPNPGEKAAFLPVFSALFQLLETLEKSPKFFPLSYFLKFVRLLRHL